MPLSLPELVDRISAAKFCFEKMAWMTQCDQKKEASEYYGKGIKNLAELLEELETLAKMFED